MIHLIIELNNTTKVPKKKTYLILYNNYLNIDKSTGMPKPFYPETTNYRDLYKKE